MGMNKADILYDCIIDRLDMLSPHDSLKVTEWVNELAELADPQASILRTAERERERLLVLATKHCPTDHHDWAEIMDIAADI